MNGTGHTAEAPPAYESPSPAPRTPQRAYEAPSGGMSSSQTMHDDSKSVGGESSYNPASEQSTVAASTMAFASGISSSSEDVKAQLAKANETIAQLRQQVEQQGLRQRKSDAVNQDSKERITTGTTGLGVQSTPTSGVPVQVVAGLCLLCFLIAYFFF